MPDYGLFIADSIRANERDEEPSSLIETGWQEMLIHADKPDDHQLMGDLMDVWCGF